MDSIQERADRIIAVSPALAREIARRFRTEPAGLTRKQTKALEFIKDFHAKHGLAPTFREMAEALGIQPSAAFYMVHRLEERGHVHMLSNRSRSIVLVEEAA